MARIGGWWPRSNNPEIDLTAVDRARTSVPFVGTIKWRRDEPVSAGEVTTLASAATAVPGVDIGTPLVAVCPGGAEPGTTRLARTWTDHDLIEAWRNEVGPNPAVPGPG